MAAWAAVGALVSGWRFGWAPRGPGTRRITEQPRSRVEPAHRSLRPRTVGGRPGDAVLAGQIRYALTTQRKDPLAVFFAVVFPVLLLMLFPAVFGDARTHGMSLAQYLLPGMAAYAIPMAGYVNMPEDVVQARGKGVLKRLQGTPLPWRWYVAGRVCSVLVVSAVSTALLAAVAALLLDVRLDPGRLPALAVGVLMGVLCFAALGLAMVALFRSANSLVAVTLGTLLPLSFVSGVFVVGDRPLPGWLSGIGAVFPLKHLMQVLLAATGPAVHGSGLAWGHLAVIAVWTVGALLVVRLVPPSRT
jgi:ABC-type transport system involved in cytochrome c biogenesis permease component